MPGPGARFTQPFRVIPDRAIALGKRFEQLSQFFFDLFGRAHGLSHLVAYQFAVTGSEPMHCHLDRRR